MPSLRYKALKAQIKQLEIALLPRRINKDIIDLSPRISLRALSFRILSHAEIEHYIEDRASEVAMAADRAWKQHRRISLTTFSLLAFSGRAMDSLPETLKPPPNKKQSDWSELIKPDKRLSKCISDYSHQIKNKNNGFKEANIISILIPLGIDPDKLDEVFIADLNDFGTKRGEAAHNSASSHLRKGINPKDEYLQVRRILEGLRYIDIQLDAILRSAIK